MATSSTRPSYRRPGLEALSSVAALSAALLFYKALSDSGNVPTWLSAVPFGSLGIDLLLISGGFVTLMIVERAARPWPALLVFGSCAWLAVSAVCLALEYFAPGHVSSLMEPRFAPLFVIGVMVSRERAGKTNWGSAAIVLLALLEMAVAGSHWGQLPPIASVFHAALVGVVGRLVLATSRWLTGSES